MNHRKAKKLIHFGVFAVGLMLSLASNMITKHIWAQSSIHTSSLPSVELVAQKSKRTADLQLLLINELMGYIEPCGCTIDLKLGSIEKLDALIRRLQNDTLSAVLTVGSHLFDHDHLKEHSLPQEHAKAKLLRSIMAAWPSDVHLDGKLDLAGGKEFYQKLKSQIPLSELSDRFNDHASYAVIKKADYKLGVIALSDQANKTEQQQVFQKALQRFKQANTHLNVVVSTMSRVQLRRLAQAHPEVQFWILGHKAQEESQLIPVEHLGQKHYSYIIEAGDRGRHLGLIKLYGVNEQGFFKDPAGDRQRQIKSLKLKIKMRERFAAMSSSPFAKRGLAKLQKELNELESSALSKDGKRVEYSLIPIDKTLASSSKVKTMVEHYQKSLKALNMKSASQVKPPPPNGNGYAGNAECSMCHPGAESFWKETRHAHAWQTLVEAKKTFDVGCVGCHVTGWQEPGGSALGHTDKLQNVQCESCHGPAAKHAEMGGGEAYVKLKVPSTQCETCHNQLHSPKFDYETYLKKVIGPGHGQPMEEE